MRRWRRRRRRREKHQQQAMPRPSTFPFCALLRTPRVAIVSHGQRAAGGHEKSQHPRCTRQLSESPVGVFDGISVTSGGETGWTGCAALRPTPPSNSHLNITKNASARRDRRHPSQKRRRRAVVDDRLPLPPPRHSASVRLGRRLSPSPRLASRAPVPGRERVPHQQQEAFLSLRACAADAGAPTRARVIPIARLKRAEAYAYASATNRPTLTVSPPSRALALASRCLEVAPRQSPPSPSHHPHCRGYHALSPPYPRPPPGPGPHHQRSRAPPSEKR